MPEFCIFCYEKAHGKQDFKSVKLSKNFTYCEGCGNIRRVVLSVKKKKFDWLGFLISPSKYKFYR